MLEETCAPLGVDPAGGADTRRAVELALLAAAIVIWKASHARTEAAADFAAARQFQFQLRPVNGVTPSGVDLVSANPGFQDAVLFDGRLVVSARAGLFVYDDNGALLHWYRAGTELPPGGLGPMSAGIAAGSARPELFIATDGAGVLAYGEHFRQVLPNDADLKKVSTVLALGSGRILIGSARKGLLAAPARACWCSMAANWLPSTRNSAEYTSRPSQAPMATCGSARLRVACSTIILASWIISALLFPIRRSSPCV